MPEAEMNNKIRLNQVRRSAVQDRMRRADGVGNNTSSEQKAKIITRKYGNEKEGQQERNYAGKLGKVATPIGAVVAAKNLVTAPTNIQAMDVPIYGIAFSLALFKDLLDLAFIGSLPAIGTVITFCISMAIGFVLIFDGISNSQRKVARRMTKKFLVLIAGTLAEGILFGLNFFPIETFTVFIIFWMSLMERRKNQ